MENIKELYDKAMGLLKDCNDQLADQPELKVINSLLPSVAKNLNEIRIRNIIGEVKDEKPDKK